jgi:hypothetical protein
MDGRKSRWEDLSNEIRKGREIGPLGPDKVKNHLLTILKSVADRERCSRNVQGWLQHRKKRGGDVELIVSSSSDAVDSWERPAILLKNLHYLHDGAALSLMATLRDQAPKGIRAYTVALEGKTRSSDLAWYARIDLTEEPEGKGLCGHPLLHCHIGSGPDEAASPETAEGTVSAQPTKSAPNLKLRSISPRVPLPWLFPWEALEWLLATTDPLLEPPSTTAGAIV